jgi:hypothetical protein
MPKAKFTAAVYLLIVFSSGALVGAVAHRLYMVKTVLSTEPPPRRLGPAEWRKNLTDAMKTKVKLDDRQVIALQEILDDTDAEFRQLHAGRKADDAKRHAEDQAVQNGMVDKVNAMLREDQRPLYQQLRAEREAERERERKRRQAAGEMRK